jgi:Ca2+-binding EF-hand superfamily protein
MFEDFNEKAETMNLHEFMTFCKNFQITTKQHKRIENHLLSQFLKSKREQNIPKDDG